MQSGLNPADSKPMRTIGAGVDRPIFNKVMTGKLTGVSIDKMVQMHSRLGKSVDVEVRNQSKRSAA
jgi:hypothetical protein